MKKRREGADREMRERIEFLIGKMKDVGKNFEINFCTSINDF